MALQLPGAKYTTAVLPGGKLSSLPEQGLSLPGVRAPQQCTPSSKQTQGGA